MTRIDDVTLLKKLGSGSFGDVYLATKAGRPGYFAAKLQSRSIMDKPENKRHLEYEINILKGLNHPNIYKIEEIKTTPEYYIILTEFVNGGSLSECLEKYQQRYKRAFPEDIVQYLMRQIIDALKYIHGKDIMHRDIKLDNIMVNFINDNDKNNLNLLRAQVKIIDFGLAIRGLGQTLAGSPLNMAPGLLNKYADSMASKICKKEVYDQKVDIWSIGAACYEMLIGKAVFDASSLSDLIEKVEIGTYVVPTTISKEIVSFLNGMLQYNSKNRLTAAQLAQHPFLTKNVRDFQRIDTKKVSKKIGNNGLNINVKQNQTIWSIFNQDDEKILLNIKGTDTNSQLNRANSLNQPPIPLTSYSSGGGSIYSQMPNNSNISNNNFIPNASTLSNNMRPNAPTIGTSFYGQSMHANNQNARMQQFQQQQQQQQPALRYAHTFNPNRINNINNTFNTNQNFPGQGNQPNYGGNMGINQGFKNNPQQQYRPMDNDDSDKEKVCLIM